MSVVPGSIAECLGLTPGEVITSFGGQKIDSAESLDQGCASSEGRRYPAASLLPLQPERLRERGRDRHIQIDQRVVKKKMARLGDQPGHLPLHLESLLKTKEDRRACAAILSESKPLSLLFLLVARLGRDFLSGGRRESGLVDKLK